MVRTEYIIFLIKQGSPKRLEDFTYSDTEMADLITESMQEVEFLGLQGYVKFDATGGVTPNIAIEQQQGGQVVQFQPSINNT